MSFLLDAVSVSQDSIQAILDDALIRYQSEYSDQIKPKYPPALAWVLIFAPLVLVSAVYFRGLFEQRKLDALWRKGTFPDYKEFERDYLLEAYLRMGTLLIINDRSEMREKKKMILAHAHKYFPDHDIDLGEFIVNAFKYPIKPQTAAKWVRKFIRNKNSKLQFIYFLVGIAAKDGDINYREEQVIREFGIEIGLNRADLERIISMHSFRNKRKHETPKKRTSLRETACKILGVSTAASQDEIKKAYRSLVKKYHPDRMIGKSSVQVKIARERFIEIQKAYEYLT